MNEDEVPYPVSFEGYSDSLDAENRREEKAAAEKLVHDVTKELWRTS